MNLHFIVEILFYLFQAREPIDVLGIGKVSGSSLPNISSIFLFVGECLEFGGSQFVISLPHPPLGDTSLKFAIWE